MSTLGLKRLITSFVARRSIPTARFFSSHTKNEELKRFMEDPLNSTMSAAELPLHYFCRAWVTDKAAHVKVFMPGLGADDVQVFIENKTLIIRGVSPYDATRAYNIEIQQGGIPYEDSKLEFRMVNGLLKVLLPLAEIQPLHTEESL